MSAGIDYSPRGSTVNRDPENGIRYGIIPMHRLAEFAYDEFESEYDAYCPNCGHELDEDTSARLCTECRIDCPHCGEEMRDGDQFGESPSRVTFDDGKTQAFLDDSGDCWVIKSEFFTRAAYCSPCAPGACYLTSPTEDGDRAYCLGPDWFDGEAPYPVYRVDTGELVTK